ncbi:MAG TPA: RNA-binding protein [Candidatus Saccharimonadales bacterium]|nr:RNA-binding protein [Candidatus Saccharimonadales bacterium]
MKVCLNNIVQKHTRIKAKGERLPLLVNSLFARIAEAVDLTKYFQIRRKEYQKNMATQNLFIGSLAYATTDDTLKAHFEQIGEVVSARVITDRDSGRSKGFGFVEMANDADNQKAIDQLDGKELDGRAISVGLARPKEDRPKRDFGGGGDRGGSGGGSFRQRSW